MEPGDLLTSPVYQSLPGNLWYREPAHEAQHYQCQPTAPLRINPNEFFVGIGIGLVVVLLVIFMPRIIEKWLIK